MVVVAMWPAGWLAGKIPCAHFPAQWTNPSPLPSPLPYPSPPAPARFMKHDNHIRRTAQGISAHGNNASRNAYNSITISFWYFASFGWLAGWKYWILQFFLACMQYLMDRRDNTSVSPEFYFCIALYIASNTSPRKNRNHKQVPTTW